MNQELTQLLWSLKEDATWAWKQSLEGHGQECLQALEFDWKQIERWASQSQSKESHETSS